MKFEINYELGYGEYDSFIVEAETIEEIKEMAEEGVHRRNGKNPWSAEIIDEHFKS